MRNEKRIKMVDWFLNLINSDLSLLDKDRLDNLITETVSILYGIPTDKIERSGVQFMPPDRWEEVVPMNQAIDEWKNPDKLRICQNHLRRKLESMMQMIDDAKDRAKRWTPQMKNYFLFGKIRSEIKVRIESPIITTRIKVENAGKVNERPLFQIDEKVLLDSPFKLAFRAERDEDTLLLYFYEALGGVSLRSLGKCPGCNSFFIRRIKNKKTFCSRNCYSRYKIRKMRKEIAKDPPKHEQFKKVETERQRRLYRKKVSGKPKRRPWKYTDSQEP